MGVQCSNEQRCPNSAKIIRLLYSIEYYWIYPTDDNDDVEDAIECSKDYLIVNDVLYIKINDSSFVYYEQPPDYGIEIDFLKLMRESKLQRILK